MTGSVVFLQPYLATYRVGFYKDLSEALADDGLRLKVAVGRLESDRGDSGAYPVEVWSDRLGHLSRDRVRWRRGRLVHGDLVVVEQAIRNLETWSLLARSHSRRPGIAMWGHGRTRAEVGRPHVAAKDFLTRKTEWFFAYTASGARDVIEHGFPRSRVTVVGNTFDTAELRGWLNAVKPTELAAFRSRHRLSPGCTALFLGGTDSAKGIDYILEASRTASGVMPEFTLLIGGSGTRIDELHAAQRAGYPIRVLGRIDGEAKAMALLAADVLAIPRAVGLVAVDALVAGLPIVTVDGQTHGPEAEYLDRDSQSVWLPEDASSATYGLSLASSLCDASRLADMSAACLRTSDQHSMPRMVEHFREGLLAWRDIHRYGL